MVRCRSTLGLSSSSRRSGGVRVDATVGALGLRNGLEGGEVAVAGLDGVECAVEQKLGVSAYLDKGVI